jgi:hypothetical protein
LRPIVDDRNFEATYRGRIHEIRRMLSYFGGIYRTKRQRIRAYRIATRATHPVPRNAHDLIESLRHSNIVDTVAGGLKNCLYYDRELFDASASNPRPPHRPPAWAAFMKAEHALEVEETLFFH